MDGGAVGAIIGSVMGLLGGAVGTYCSIKNTAGPKEKAFMVKCALVGWVAISLFLVLLFSLPRPQNFLLWIPYSVALPLGIRFCNQRQRNIREAEHPSSASPHGIVSDEVRSD